MSFLVEERVANRWTHIILTRTTKSQHTAKNGRIIKTHSPWLLNLRSLLPNHHIFIKWLKKSDEINIFTNLSNRFPFPNETAVGFLTLELGCLIKVEGTECCPGLLHQMYKRQHGDKLFKPRILLEGFWNRSEVWSTNGVGIISCPTSNRKWGSWSSVGGVLPRKTRWDVVPPRSQVLPIPSHPWFCLPRVSKSNTVSVCR